MKRIGILAVQGAFAEHKQMLKECGIDGIELRKKSDLTAQTLDGIILPGGESTVMGKLLVELNMLEQLRGMIKEGLPVFGTCAGLILLAKHIVNDNRLHLATMDISVKRNAYGRQLGSFKTYAEFRGIGDIPMTFIRAPYIERVSREHGVEILAQLGDHIVAARQENMLVTSFHPELTGDNRLHDYFLNRIVDRIGKM